MRTSLLLAALCVATSCSCGSEGGPQGPPPAPVTVAEATVADVPVQLETIGTVESINTVEIKSRVTGQLESVEFEPGSIVEEGQKLFQLDPRPFVNAVEAAEAGLAEARTQARLAATEAKRYTELERRGAAATQQADQARAAAQTAVASVEAAVAALEGARLDLTYTSIEAPVRGRTGELLVHIGDQIQANAVTPMVTVEVMQPIFVRFAVPGDRLPAIRTSMREGEVPVVATPRGGGEPRHGTLTFVDNQVDPNTGTILLKATYANEDETFWPGEPVDVALTIEVLQGVVVVPSAAVQIGPEGPFVFVVDEAGAAILRPIRAGPQVDDTTAVLEGVAQGERVVTSGQLRLAPGSPVEIREPPP